MYPYPFQVVPRPSALCEVLEDQDTEQGEIHNAGVSTRRPSPTNLGHSLSLKLPLNPGLELEKAHYS